MTPYRIQHTQTLDPDEFEWRRRRRRAETIAWLREAALAILEVVVYMLLS